MGAGLVTIGIAQYGALLAKIVSLYNMNTIATGLLVLWIFAEWKQVQVPRLLVGTALTILGGILVARA